MSETEKLLAEAQRLARTAFDSPTQETVMGLMRELCDERNRVAYAEPKNVCATLH